MTQLDDRLDDFLRGRKQKGRFRSLKEYDTSPHSGLTDFVSLLSCLNSKLINRLGLCTRSRQMTISH